MKILLIVPRYNFTNKVDYQYVFPLGLAYITAVVKKEGYDLECINLNHFSGTIESIINDKFKEKQYDIVLTGHIGVGYEIIEKIIKSIKSISSDIKIIVGGSLVTCEKELMLESLGHDFSVLGEGEKTIIELLDSIQNKKPLENVNGIGYKDNSGKLIFTKPRDLILDLDSLPFPDFESLDYLKYLDNQTSSSNYFITDYPRAYPIICSRGCPNQCTFCYHSIGFRYRMRSLDNIFSELSIVIKKYNINSIEINDDLFSLNRARLYEFCNRIKSLSNNGEPITWSCQLMVNNLDIELLKTLKDAGCNVVSFGFESYNKDVLKSMKKPITPEQIDHAIKLSMEANMGIQGNFIFGDVAETKETAKETLDYWKKECKGQLRLLFIQPYPGSEIYNMCIKKGIIKDKLDFIKNHMNHINWFNMTSNMTDQEVMDLKKEILRLRTKYYPYVIPSSLTKIKDNRYSINSTCPYCKTLTSYKNCAIENKIHYNLGVTCRKCFMRYFIVSRISKFEMDYYNELEFLRKNYLFIRDKLRKTKM